MERMTFLNGDDAWCVDNENCFEEQSERYCGPAIDRLAYYEDMEEQGRLVVLPCKVGDSFFVIADICLCPPNENGCDECDKCSECRYAEQEILERKFNSVLQIINIEKNFGKTVFLTREEAEQALKGGANQ